MDPSSLEGWGPDLYTQVNGNRFSVRGKRRRLTTPCIDPAMIEETEADDDL